MFVGFVLVIVGLLLVNWWCLVVELIDESVFCFVLLFVII